MAQDLAKLLNPPQLDAATWPQGPICIVAGAGSGKTRVITHRLAFLVREGLARPEELLAVTFTNKAAKELRERVDHLLPGVGGRLWVSTFHSMAARILREAHKELGLPRNFTIYDQDDSERLLKQVSEELRIPTDVQKLIFPRLESLEHDGTLPDAFEPQQFDLPAKWLKSLYTTYWARLKTAGAVDFGGLLLHALKVIRDFPTASYSLARVRHAVVDEFQDVNRAQSSMVETLAARLKSLAVVGDDDQSIYRWRGASAYSLLSFTQHFKDAHTVRLTENYRSSNRILKLANEVIRKNPGRLGKELWTQAGEGQPIRLRSDPTDREEAAFVVDDIQDVLRVGRKPSDVAVLYRTNGQSRVLEEALHRARLPYKIIGGLRFYERREVKDVVAYLRLVANPQSEMDFRRIVNVPSRGIGDTTLSQLAAAAQQANVSITDALELSDDAWGRANMKGAGRTKLREFAMLLAEIRRACAGKPPTIALTEIVARTGYDQALRLEEDGEERLENLQSLHRAAADFEEDMTRAGETATVENFLERVTLETDVQAAGESADAVSMMTLHSAKGLEFDVVYMVGVEENILPSSRSIDSSDPEALHEERRLCYVGMTRARERLTISFCRRRQTFGDIRMGVPSRFLTELPEDFVREHFTGNIEQILPVARPVFRNMPMTTSFPSAPPKRAVERGSTTVVYDDDGPPPPRIPRPAPKPAADVLDLDDLDEGDVMPEERGAFPVGSRVRHASYGDGRVVGCSGSGPMARVDVDFASAGVRRIVARFLVRTR